MPNVIDDLCYQLALANRIVAHEGVLDGFGHISVRHPDKPDHYLLSRSRSPELVEPGRHPRVQRSIPRWSRPATSCLMANASSTARSSGRGRT